MTTPFEQAPTRNPRVVVRSPHAPGDVTFKFQVNFVTLQSGVVTEPAFHQLLQMLQPKSGYYLCPGLPKNTAEQLPFNTRSARKWGYPFETVDHKKCSMWFYLGKVPKNLGRPPTCEHCSQLYYHMTKKAKEWESITPEHKRKRTLASSNYPLKCLTHRSLKSRMELVRP